jgi:HSP20 family molecular chaperone IbpA
MPARVEVKKATSNYKNGVLDIIVPKKKQEETKETDIQIE